MVTATLYEDSITGLNTDGEMVTTVVMVEANPDWSPETNDSEYRFHVVSLVDDEEDSREDFDDLDQATAYADELLRDAAAEIEEAVASLREEHVDALDELANGWHEGEDRELAAAVATLISGGKAAQALAALRAAGLIAGGAS